MSLKKTLTSIAAAILLAVGIALWGHALWLGFLLGIVFTYLITGEPKEKGTGRSPSRVWYCEDCKRAYEGGPACNTHYDIP